MSEIKTPLFDVMPHLEGDRLNAKRAGNLVVEAMSRYSEPWRHHHNIDHLSDVVSFLLENIDELDNPRRTLWAGIDHDIVYVPQASLIPGANEELSAQLNQRRLTPYLTLSEVLSSGEFIKKTADHDWDGQDMDLAYLLDADLKILGAPEDEFDEYDRNIRREYSFVPLDQYSAARQQVLRGFYDQDRLFITDIAHEQFEDQAKSNLERRLSQF